MKAYVAVTDGDWFRHLRPLADLDEVNFWTPRPWGGRFRVLSRGEPLLFKLRAPVNRIVGGGFFERYVEMPISFAWEVFGEKNGAASYEAMRSRIGRLRHEPVAPWENYPIGCILLEEPFFWPEELWLRPPPDWSPNTQRGAGYDLRSRVGRELWEQVVARLQAGERPARVAEASDSTVPGGYGDPLLRPHRVGQGTFRAVITEVYERRCAITREKALPALDAAHIRPFQDEPVHYIRNGLLLRSDVHRLFDRGYLTVTPEYHVEASPRMREDFDDGENYLRLHGSEVWVPGAGELRPDPDALRWHNDHVFRT